MNQSPNQYKAGLDVGSTTAKLAIIDHNGNLVFSDYRRHNTKIYETTIDIFEEALKALGDTDIDLAVTGSAGMGVSERLNTPFIQEVIASVEVLKKHYPEVKTLIDIGGEDSKMIFIHPQKAPDIRMNGSCAGGTGAYIDQMATLLNVTTAGLNDLAKNSTQLYPIASRCGVFAKTDVQNLISRKIPKEDIAASIFHAVAIQTMNTLARGFDIDPKIMFTGGPFTFLPELAKAFVDALKIAEENIIIPPNPELLPAIGCAFYNSTPVYKSINEILTEIRNAGGLGQTIGHRLTPLFNNSEEFESWSAARIKTKVPTSDIANYDGHLCFLGIDSGSTTTKITIIGKNKELLFKYYANNKGNPVETVEHGLRLFKDELSAKKKQITIAGSSVTGYGEDLIKAALGIDHGIVETMAHFTAAKHFNPNVTFIMDIGGQDMKAIFITNGIINRIELNESCSSGCGSFIETFGNSLGFQVADFAQLACTSKAPCDLGTRCTVFMNSKVKQSLRENAATSDISAGLSISVIKNAIFKVLKLRDYTELGDNIVVQGGTFRNPSVHRALEMLTGKTIICSDIPELMGAYGAAIHAYDSYLNNPLQINAFIGLENLDEVHNYKTSQLTCKGCENNCTITKFTFSNNSVFYSGNKCEKVFSSKGQSFKKGFNLFEFKNNLIFDRNTNAKTKKRLTIGIPRILNMYDNFPFWSTLLTECGFDIILSSPSTMNLYKKGLGTVMSDSICFPAKIVHGHILDLVDKKVDRIFYPFVFFEDTETEQAQNSFNCPIVSSYSDVIRSAVNTETKYNIPLDSPTINFQDEELLNKACFNYLKQFGVSKSLFQTAYQKSVKAKENFKAELKAKSAEVIEKARRENRLLIVLAGRPYHTDPLVNHKTPNLIASLGVDVISEDSIPDIKENKEDKLQVIAQWSYPNRIYHAALWVSLQPENFQLVQLNSFGCGPDAIVIDECVDILKTKNKNHTLLKIDDITSTGSIRLRIRSLIESLQNRNNQLNAIKIQRITTVTFKEEDKKRTILAPYFAEMYSPFLPALFELAGYKMINLPKPDKESVEFGLKYSNNEICYPATLVVGDAIKALKSGKYKRDEIAIGITQTGGQCRATSYISLIKKAMVAAGFDDVPVISVNSGNMANDQPGFKIDWKKMLPITFSGILFADSIAKLYYSSAVRETKKGSSRELLDKYTSLGIEALRQKNSSELYRILKNAVAEFNQLNFQDKIVPKIGIVGEIYVKYNSFGHQYIVDWLTKQGIEVVVPPILDFFIQAFVNIDINKKSNLERATFSSQVFVFYLEQYANFYIRKANRILSKFKFYDPFTAIRDIAGKASRILHLANQFGEGWLIPAEIAEFAEHGIHNVVSVQPFGCIANHVISKGVEKRIKDLYPQMSLLFLDFDDGATEVNVLNRLHFMVKNVKEFTTSK